MRWEGKFKDDCDDALLFAECQWLHLDDGSCRLDRILRGATNADRMMATQLFGTGGIAALLLFSAAADLSAVADVALVLALLAAFASVAFVKNASPETEDL